MTSYTMTLAEAKAHLEDLLTEKMSAPGWSAYIELWQDGPWGIRVAEVGATNGIRGIGHAGWSMFQSDPDASNAILATERALVALTCWPREDDETVEAIEDALFAVTQRDSIR